MSKIYAVYRYGGSWEDKWSVVDKCFKDLDKAKAYMEEIYEDEKQNRFITTKCLSCAVADKKCPFWTEPDFYEGDCGTRDEYELRDEIYFRIETLELEE